MFQGQHLYAVIVLDSIQDVPFKVRKEQHLGGVNNTFFGTERTKHLNTYGVYALTSFARVHISEFSKWST